MMSQGTSGKAELHNLLHLAMGLVAESGLKGLSLRPLAERSGTTAPALIRRFGSKEGLMATLIRIATEEDGAFLDRWLGRIKALQNRDARVMIDLADAILSDFAGPEGLRTRFYCELLQGVVSRPEMAVAVATWSARRLEFWRAAAMGLSGDELGEVLHAFSMGEAAYGLAIGDLAAYRWLRRLCLRRLCCGLIPADGSAEVAQFHVFRQALGELLDDPGRPAATPMTEWQRKVAGHISALIVDEGADAVTHRAIAARAGLANSTLAYHFPRQEDLLVAGLNDIVDRVHRATGTVAAEVPPDFQLTSIQSARATFAVALVATRMPALKGATADLRRRRGENNVGYLARLHGEAVFDIVAAQAISITGMGALILDAVLEAPVPGISGFGLADRMRAAAIGQRSFVQT